jgi:hypothetical protein
MNTPTTATVCRCVNCPGANCRCGCQAEATPPAAAAARPACACGPSCGCDAAEQGCLCGSRAS